MCIRDRGKGKLNSDGKRDHMVWTKKISMTLHSEEKEMTQSGTKETTNLIQNEVQSAHVESTHKGVN